MLKQILLKLFSVTSEWKEMENQIRFLELVASKATKRADEACVELLNARSECRREVAELNAKLKASMDNEALLAIKVRSVELQGKPSDREKRYLRELGELRQQIGFAKIAEAQRMEMQSVVAELTKTNALLTKTIAELTAPQVVRGDGCVV